MAGTYRSNGHHRDSSMSPLNGRPAARKASGRRWQSPGRVARDLAARSAPDVRVAIDSDRAIVEARRHARRLSTTVGLRPPDLTIVVTVISELASNALLFAKGAEIRVSIIQDDTRQGILVVATDQGPGIADVDRALEDGYSTAGRLGLGLPGVKRLMDEFEITTAPAGTTVVARKWKR